MPFLTFVILLSFNLIRISSYSILDYSHNANDTLSIHVGPWTSVNYLIPFDFTRLEIHDKETLKKQEDTWGEILSGDDTYSTQYEVFTNRNEFCKWWTISEFQQKNVMTIGWLYNRNYYTNWYVDKLPAGLYTYNPITKQANVNYTTGIPLGYHVNSNGNTDFYIYNHYQFHIFVHKTEQQKYEVVGFHILPFSIAQTNSTLNCVKTKEESDQLFRKEKQKLEEGGIAFTYDVLFEESNLTLVTRWDHYRHINTEIHWFGIITGNVIMLFFTVIVWFIFCRSIKNNIEIYNSRVVKEEILDEFGWKQVCNDVFRPSRNIMLWSTFVGTGIQLFTMMYFTLMLAVFGFKEPEKRSQLLTLCILFYVFMGIWGGITSARVYKIWQGKHWLKNAILTAILFPGILFIGYTFINIVLILEKSSAAVNFLDILSLLILWLCCSSPLVLIGSFFGIKCKPIKIPCKVNPLPTTIPSKPWYFQFKFTFFVVGIFSFSTVFIEFYYFMDSLWQHQIYFLITFLWLVLTILLVVSVEITILLIFINLCKGDYVWWWKSFLFGGSSAIYVLAYSIYYFFYLNITRLSAMCVYFALMGLITTIVFLVNGSQATVFTFIFLKKMYSMIKVD